MLAALGWKMLMAAFADGAAAHPADQWLDVRYEDLVDAAPEQSGPDAGLPRPGLVARLREGLLPVRLHVGRAEAYRDELSPAQLAAVERVLEKPLAEWGYPV